VAGNDGRAEAGASLLDPFKPYLIGRIEDGCLKASVLHRAVVTQGFTGGYGIVRDFVKQHRARPDLRTIPRPLSTRQVTGWTCRHPDNLTERDTTRLTTVLGNCPELRTAAELVRFFAAIMTQRHGHRLGEWLTSAEQANLFGINRFVNGVTSDLDAVTAGLSLPFSSGPVEGNVNRIILWNQRLSMSLGNGGSPMSVGRASCQAVFLSGQRWWKLLNRWCVGGDSSRDQVPRTQLYRTRQPSWRSKSRLPLSLPARECSRVVNP
jgi:hypothetical protein